MPQGGFQPGPAVHYVRTDAVSRKREERMVREAYRREKKLSSYLADDENFPSFRNQLAKIGLELRDIPGDGYVILFLMHFYLLRLISLWPQWFK